MDNMDNDFEAALDEAKMVSSPSSTDELPESPASANIKVWIRGFGVMFTMRDKKMNNVVSKVETLIQIAGEKGWKNKWDDAPLGANVTSMHSRPTTVAQTPTNTPICGVHGTPMTWKTGNYKATTPYHKMGDEYAFWSCSQKNADGSYCKFKPTKEQ